VPWWLGCYRNRRRSTILSRAKFGASVSPLAPNRTRPCSGSPNVLQDSRDTVPCEGCGAAVWRPNRGRCRFCPGCRSLRKQDAKKRYRTRNPIPAAPSSRPCPTCGTAIERRGKVYAAFCSDACKPRCSFDPCDGFQRKLGLCESHYEQKRRTGVVSSLAWTWSGDGKCKGCSKDVSGRVKCCSFACYLHVRNHDGNPPVSIICVQCGTGVPVGVVAGRKRGKRADTKMCRRCRQDLSKYGLSVHDLVNRDGPDCWLCLTTVDLKLRAPDPGCPSIDHVLPRAAGGGNDPSNLRLAHLRCNILKHDKVIAT
jgi:endogenous inhibitor of DNA gyrase (YacG/DUF329 family)